MTSEKKPFFSVVIPLYNKQNHVRETLETVFAQTFQDFEIVIVNDGSTDDSAKVVEAINDNRIRLIHQDNTGVSVARNRGIKEAKADYIAFLDADDIWLPEFLETIYKLIKKFPDAGLYATSYKTKKTNGEENSINIQGLPSKDYKGLIPNYFESIVKGDNLVWTSAICIPKDIFVENDIWFPVGEKYGEDQYVWARVAIGFDIVYNTKPCAIYMIESENNTMGEILKENEPHQSILMLKNHRNTFKDIEKLKFFDIYLEKHIVSFIFRNIQNGYGLYGIQQLFQYKVSIAMKIKLLIRFCMPTFIYENLKKLYKSRN